MKQILYDTETTGAAPRFDQILQAAAVLVDEDFQVLDTMDVRSRLARHIVPHPMALKVTGVEPHEIDRAPYDPYGFSRMLLNTFRAWSQGGAVFAGWNSMRFDEEILRQTFWENLHKPYLTNTGGNTRIDYLVMARALYARNPEAIAFPITEETGRPNFRLENLAPLNGLADHAAHDALGDVLALAHVARLIRDVDPDLYHQIHAMGDARRAQDFVEGEVVFRMIAGSFLEPAAATVCLLGSETRNGKSKLAFNLGHDPEPLMDLDVDGIVAKINEKGGPFRRVRCNQAPGLFPVGWGFTRLLPEIEATPHSVIDARAARLAGDRDFKRRVEAAMDAIASSYGEPDTLEEKIYAGFPSRADERRMEDFHAKDDWRERLEIVRAFESATLRSLGVRAIYVNAPEAMPEALRASCDRMVAENRLTLDRDRKWTTLGAFYAATAEMEDRALAAVYDAWAAERWGVSAEAASAHRAAQAARDAEAAALETARKETAALEVNAARAEARATQHAEKAAARNAAKTTASCAPAPASRAHFLDGIE